MKSSNVVNGLLSAGLYFCMQFFWFRSGLQTSLLTSIGFLLTFLAISLVIDGVAAYIKRRKS